MGHIYKWLGTDDQIKELWQNREALNKYLDRLKELMEKDEDVGMCVDKEAPIADATLD
jgi:hypothetical protein